MKNRCNMVNQNNVSDWPEHIIPGSRSCSFGVVQVSNTESDAAILKIDLSYGITTVRIVPATKVYNTTGELKGVYTGNCATYTLSE